MKAEKQNRKFVLPAAVGICVIACVVMVWALTVGGRTKTAEFTPPPFDPAAEAGTPEVPEALGWGAFDARSFRASVCGAMVLDGQTADVWLTNPVSNAVWLKLRILDERGEILGETGLIRPGEYVQTIRFETVPETGEPIVLKIMAYQPETYYSEGTAVLNTVVTEGGKH